MRWFRVLAISVSATVIFGCGDDGSGDETPLDPDTAPQVVIDRFSGPSATLMVRDAVNGLPGPGAPIDFAQPPFISHGFAPDGSDIAYYNFDVRRETPINIYILHHVGEGTPVPGQLPIVDYIPGEFSYNDFWRVVRVDVPADYVANTVTSTAAINRKGFPLTVTDAIVNCPLVPAGSTAPRRLGSTDTELHRGWYKDQIVHYFTFAERSISVVDQKVPTAPIYVTFNINPGDAGGGPPSGAKTEPGTDQTHNVLGAVPGEAVYSPLWSVQVYDNADFDTVLDLTSAQAARQLVPDAMLVNCPAVPAT
jgi:hypothetical protein